MKSPSLVKRAKRVVLTAARTSGVLRQVAGSRWRSSRLLILCYHGVALKDEHEWNPELFVSSEQLRQRFAMLRDRGYSVLPLADAARRLQEGNLPPRSVSLTFDDGNHDFYARAVPLLQEFQFPATVYLTTYYSDDQRPVFDPAVSYVLWKGRGRSFDTTGLTAERVTATAPIDPAERRALVARIHQHAREALLSADEKDASLRILCLRLGVEYDALVRDRLLYIMTREEVRAAALTGLVDVQLHTRRHRTPRDRALFTREVEENARDIGGMVPGARPSHFCYPSGDVDPMFLPWLRELGVATATTCEPGFGTAATDPLLLPRFVDTMHNSAAEFEGWLSGFAALLPHRHR